MFYSNTTRQCILNRFLKNRRAAKVGDRDQAPTAHAPSSPVVSKQHETRNRPDQVFCNRTGFSRIRNQYPVYRILPEPEPGFLGIFFQAGFEPDLCF